MIPTSLRNFCMVAAAMVFVGHIGAASAALVEPDYKPEEPYVTTPWFESYDYGNFVADDNYIKGMRPHHEGALSMSEGYLVSAKKASKRLQRLARGIIHNQKFEILMLNEVDYLINQVDFSSSKASRKAQVATNGLAQREKFVRAAIPSLWGSETNVSEEDVRFAKAMIIHHEGALVMCEEYLQNPDSGNGYLERMCLDILRDQTQEIKLMHDIIADYDGNPDDVKVDRSMVHGMDGMMHGKMGHKKMQCKKAKHKDMQCKKMQSKETKCCCH